MLHVLGPDLTGEAGPGIDDDRLARVLDDLGDRLGRAGIEWCLGGSAARRVRGADRAPRDLDVVVDAGAADALAAALGHLQPPDHPSPGNWRSAWLRAWHRSDGVMVEFIGGAAVVLDGQQVDLPSTPSTYVHWRGRPRPISDLAVWNRLAPGGRPSSREPER